MFEVVVRKEGSQGPGTALWLPADPYELLDALDRVGTKRLDEIQTMVTAAAYDIPALGPSPDFARLNALAERLTSLNALQRTAFLGLAHMESRGTKGPLTVSRALDLAYSTDCCHVVEAMNDRQLGRFYAEEGFVQSVDGLPDDIFELLDFEKIGREMRLAEGGVFVEGGNDVPGAYVVRHSELKQAPPVPEQLQRPNYIFRFTLQNEKAPKRTAVLDLPATREKLDEVLRTLNADTWTNVRITGYDGAIPDPEWSCGYLDSIEQLNELAEALRPVVEKGQLSKFKAVLEAARCSDPDQMERIAEHLDEYVFSPNLRSGRDIALSELRCMLDDETLELLLPHLDAEGFGRAIAGNQNSVVTAYGTIERRDGGPIQDLEPPAPEMGVMTL